MISEFLGAALNFRKRQKICCTLYMSSKKMKLGIFTSQSYSDGKEMYQIVCYTCEVFFLLNKPYYLFKHSVVMAVVIARC